MARLKEWHYRPQQARPPSATHWYGVALGERKEKRRSCHLHDIALPVDLCNVYVWGVPLVSGMLLYKGYPKPQCIDAVECTQALTTRRQNEKTSRSKEREPREPKARARRIMIIIVPSSQLLIEGKKSTKRKMGARTRAKVRGEASALELPLR